MDNESFKYQPSQRQPFDENLKGVLPVNYFLFTERPINPELISRRTSSVFYDTDSYMPTQFYKAVSNIL